MQTSSWFHGLHPRNVSILQNPLFGFLFQFDSDLANARFCFTFPLLQIKRQTVGGKCHGLVFINASVPGDMDNVFTFDTITFSEETEKKLRTGLPLRDQGFCLLELCSDNKNKHFILAFCSSKCLNCDERSIRSPNNGWFSFPWSTALFNLANADLLENAPLKKQDSTELLLVHEGVHLITKIRFWKIDHWIYHSSWHQQ